MYEVIVSPEIQTKNCQDFCPHYRPTYVQGSYPEKILVRILEKRWLPPIFILKITDLSQCVPWR